MNTAQIIAAIDSNTLPYLSLWEPSLSSTEIGELGGHPVIQKLIPLALEAVSCSISAIDDPLVKDETGQYIGTLCMLTKRGYVQIAGLTQCQRVAYLVDAEYGENEENYQFRYDYFVVDEAKYHEYMAEYYRSSPIWGGFLHIPYVTSANPCLEIRAETIVARSGIKLPTSFNLGSARHAILCSHSFDRYLRFYHQLELIFDWVICRRIQALGPDLDGFAKIISSYHSTDFARLKHLVLTYCVDISKLEQALLAGSGYGTIAHDMFHHFTKEGDPTKKENEWKRFWTLIETSDLNLAAAKRSGLVHNQDEYNILIQETTAYWIYRIRGSIAHNRIGEYILTDDKEEFVAVFGEPLLLECLMQIFSNPGVASLISP
ncbi:MAG: hypothetical protein ABSA18_05455 [Dehalococcoidia bacterium]|jgi:hypothetical protein